MTKTEPAIDYCLNAMKHARIMATEAYLNQDGRSIIAASDFKDIEQYLLEAIEVMGRDDAKGMALQVGGVPPLLDDHTPSPPASSSEISDIHPAILEDMIRNVLEGLGSSHCNAPITCASQIRMTIEPFMRTTKPVTVSLDKGAQAIKFNDMADSPWDRIGESEALRIAKTCAEAWWLPYVD